MLELMKKSDKKHCYYSTVAENKTYSTQFTKYIYYFLNEKIEDRLFLIAYGGNVKIYKDWHH
jgi:hypothetical protein